MKENAIKKAITTQSKNRDTLAGLESPALLLGNSSGKQSKWVSKPRPKGRGHIRLP